MRAFRKGWLIFLFFLSFKVNRCLKFYYKSISTIRFMSLCSESPSVELQTSRKHFVQPHYLALNSLSNVLNFCPTFYQVTSYITKQKKCDGDIVRAQRLLDKLNDHPQNLNSSMHDSHCYLNPRCQMLLV